MKRVKLSDEAYRLLEEYRKQLSEELGREISYTEALARLLGCGGEVYGAPRTERAHA